MRTLYDDTTLYVTRPGEPMFPYNLQVVEGAHQALIVKPQLVDRERTAVLGYSLVYAAEYLATPIVNLHHLDPATTAHIERSETIGGVGNSYQRVTFEWRRDNNLGQWSSSHPRWAALRQRGCHPLFSELDRSLASVPDAE